MIDADFIAFGSFRLYFTGIDGQAFSSLRSADEALAAALALDTRLGEWKWNARKEADVSREA
jgi:hypothetical protein